MDDAGTDRSGSAGRVDRRLLIGATAATATVAAFWVSGIGNPLRRRRVEPTAPGAGRASLTDAEWAALDAAMDRILPSDPDAPGARDVNAIGYLDAALAAPDADPETVTRVKEGARLLDERARAAGVDSFGRLPPERRDGILRTLEGDVAFGVVWLRDMVAFTCEALLGDPVYGGNTDERGWRWLGHRPGTPRPKQARRD